MAQHIYRPTEPYYDPTDGLDASLDTASPSSDGNPSAYLDFLVACNDIGTDERDAGEILYGMTWRADLPHGRPHAMLTYPWRDRDGVWSDQRATRAVVQERVKSALSAIRSDRRRAEVKRFILRRPLEDTTPQLALGLWDVSRHWWPARQQTHQRNGITLAGSGFRAMQAANDNTPSRRVVQSPLDTLLSRGVVTDVQHAAGVRYYSDWYHSGLSGIGGIDYSSVTSGAGHPPHMMPLTGLMAIRRAEYRSARASLTEPQRQIMQAVVLDERPMADAAKEVTGVGRRSEALRLGGDTLRGALDVLAAQYGLVGRTDNTGRIRVTRDAA